MMGQSSKVGQLPPARLAMFENMQMGKPLAQPKVSQQPQPNFDFPRQVEVSLSQPTTEENVPPNKSLMGWVKERIFPGGTSLPSAPSNQPDDEPLMPNGGWYPKREQVGKIYTASLSEQEEPSQKHSSRLTFWRKERAPQPVASQAPVVQEKRAPYKATEFHNVEPVQYPASLSEEQYFDDLLIPDGGWYPKREQIAAASAKLNDKEISAQKPSSKLTVPRKQVSRPTTVSVFGKENIPPQVSNEALTQKPVATKAPVQSLPPVREVAAPPQEFGAKLSVAQRVALINNQAAQEGSKAQRPIKGRTANPAESAPERRRSPEPRCFTFSDEHIAAKGKIRF